MRAIIGQITVDCDWLIRGRADHVLMAQYKTGAVQKMNAVLPLHGLENVRVQTERNRSYLDQFSTIQDTYRNWKIKTGQSFQPFYVAVVLSSTVGENYILSTAEEVENDYYNYLYSHFKFPLLPEWKEYLFLESLNRDAIGRVPYPVVSENPNVKIPIGCSRVCPAQVVVYQMGISEGILREIISDGLMEKKIVISDQIQNPLVLKDLDSYMLQYGDSIGKNLEKNNVRPRTSLKRSVQGLALLERKLYPRQAACTNGIIKAMQEKKDNFVLATEEMGCGKTIQAIAAVEAAKNQKWLRTHPGKTLRDCLLSKEVAYRVAVICPSHLCKKWRLEILKQIPDTKVTLVTDLMQLEELRNRRKERNGKEIYIFSKELAKGDTHKRPVPSHIATKYGAANICLDCLVASASEDNTGQMELLKKEKPFLKKDLAGLTISPMRSKNGVMTCIKCHGHHAHLMLLEDYGRYSGLVCPECDNLLLKENMNMVIGRIEDDLFESLVLQPKDFAAKVQGNERCSCCGTSLWEDNVESMTILGDGTKIRAGSRSPWKKIKFYSDYAKMQGEDAHMNASAYTLPGYELSTVAAKGVGTEYADAMRTTGPRRFPEGRFCKKYLKGAFDVLIGDEAHMYAGVRTEQATAMHNLKRASKFSIFLTGTLSNGTASSMFCLFFILMPREMIKRGYSYTTEGMMDFAKKYGVVETEYESNENSNGYSYTSSGRGRMLKRPQVRAGISVLIYPHFLTNHCVTLNIGDLSSHMPPLHEYVRELPMQKDVETGYQEALTNIKDALKRRDSDEGKGLVGKMLQFGLSYPDKPYGRKTIWSLKQKNLAIVEPVNLDRYKSTSNLLPKEQEMVNIINKEQAEGRNVFVYTFYSGEDETNINNRLKSVIEDCCNLKGRVCILDSKKVKAADRDEYIKKHSDKVKVWVTNYINVETGIDFVGEYEGREYNYPTIIYMQMGMGLASVWQASRRAYRLNQTKECRTYYLVYKSTFQRDMLEMMSKKISAATAIQGNFSESALQDMMGTEDPQIKLVKKLLSGNQEDTDTNLEDLLLQTRNNVASENDESEYVGEEPVTYYDVVGKNGNTIVSFKSGEDFGFSELFTIAKSSESTDNSGPMQAPPVVSSADSFFSFFGSSNDSQQEKKPSRKKEKHYAGQMSLFA